MEAEEDSFANDNMIAEDTGSEQAVSDDFENVSRVQETQDARMELNFTLACVGKDMGIEVERGAVSALNFLRACNNQIRQENLFMFSCLSRTYKYLFWRENLNLAEMEIAGMKFVGEHDFRNFCKMDAANVHNYRRHITSFEFSRCNSRSEGDELWAMTINGSAFLWHQIRCMVAVLFMIGHGLELPSVIDELLDTNRTPRKPQYVMASELPLILQSCEFERLRYICSPDAGQSLREHLKNEIRHYELQAAIFQEALLSCSHTIKDRSPSSHVKKKAAHIPLMSRPTEPSYEERQAKHKARTV
ncbi:tRNA pseudouridine synthase [Thalictrum thalictroides]|uniref:tRNA pseudouridine synthase n=1 Tax=Thalictrum thalictroides TaxID=46969 RepID=A0A7J6WIX6_THATH|nr:tRNA pseudouridine synthase [Thalictrum thalictroides]